MYNFAAGRWYQYERDFSLPGHYTSNPRKFEDLTSGAIVFSPGGSFAPYWTTPNMYSAHARGTATTLPNGKVLIAGGGIGRPYPAFASTDIFDPTSNTFETSTPSMNVARAYATATLLPNDSVLIAGGEPSFTVSPPSPSTLASTEIYDSSSNSFATSTPSMNIAREQATATLLPNGKVLIAGGLDESGDSLASTEIYDPSTNSFAASTPSMNIARAGATATLLPNGMVVIVGGFLVANGSSAWNSLASTEIYDPSTNTFATSTPTMNVARANATATLLPNGAILIAGGYNPHLSVPVLASTDIFDPSTSTFATSTPTMNVARAYATATLLLTGNVLIAGGDTSTEIYYSATNTFAASTPSMSVSREYATVSLLPNGQVLIAGGQDGGVPGALSRSTDIYTP
ncbi:MAG TPA: kelch repeat-containing protein [Candidatus Binataceae bacterium]|nr:kelch repeat-containing protein [Candidatus Binataceae bacterium]